MTLVYGITVVLAVIIGSVTGHILVNYIAKRMDERQFNRAFKKALEEAAEDAIKDIERIKFYEKIKAEQEKGCWESYRIQKSPKGYIVVLICPHRAKAIDIPQSFTAEHLKDLLRQLFNCRYKKEQK